MELTEDELFEQEMEAEGRDLLEADKVKEVPVVFSEESGQVELVWDPTREGHMIWIPF